MTEDGQNRWTTERQTDDGLQVTTGRQKEREKVISSPVHSPSLPQYSKPSWRLYYTQNLWVWSQHPTPQRLPYRAAGVLDKHTTSQPVQLITSALQSSHVKRLRLTTHCLTPCPVRPLPKNPHLFH